LHILVPSGEALEANCSINKATKPVHVWTAEVVSNCNEYACSRSEPWWQKLTQICANQGCCNYLRVTFDAYLCTSNEVRIQDACGSTPHLTSMLVDSRASQPVYNMHTLDQCAYPRTIAKACGGATPAKLMSVFQNWRNANCSQHKNHLKKCAPAFSLLGSDSESTCEKRLSEKHFKVADGTKQRYVEEFFTL
jgi:hypothetical protein